MDDSLPRISVKLNGTRNPDASLWLASLGGKDGLFETAGSTTAYDLHPAGARGSGELAVDASIPRDALVEVEFDNGLRFWTLGENLRERLQPPGQRQARGVTDDGGAWTLPSAVDLPGGRRGAAGKLVLKALRWVGFDAVKAGRDKLVALAETRSVPREGLFPVGDDGIAGAPLTEPIPDGGPALILLHGTASCTRGSFSKLWLRQGEHWATLRKYFGARIYALEHRTLTASPIANALHVAQLLPKSGRVSFLSHSRGGLVGELLCLDAQAIDAGAAVARLDAQKKRADAENTAIDQQVADFEALLAELRRRPQLQIERFVRVACPVLGTSLAGDKLDKWGSLLVLAAIADEMRRSGKRGISLGDIGESLVKLGLDTISETVAGILASRRRADELPGLQAMMPGSAVVSLVNASPGRGELYVVAGDAQPLEGDWLADLRFWLTDRYYERDHDLVVDTRAMLDGPLRSTRPDGPRCKVQFRSGSDVNHFSYFGNADSARAIAAALTLAPAADTLFRGYFGRWPLADEAGAARGLFGPRPVADPALDQARGIVVIVPGLCGSELKLGTRDVWANLLALAGGAFNDDLRYDNKSVAAGQPLPDSYLGLANALRKRGYIATLHGYDWRKPVADSVDGLAKTLGDALAKAQTIGKPVHAIVHSMGGVLIRATLARDEALWKAWNSQPGEPRVVMLGTPNQGSHAITLLVTARDKFFRQLAFLDICHSQEELLATAVGFPGVMELLPVSAQENGAEIREADTWKRFRDADKGARWPLPAGDVLAQSGELWASLARHDPLIASERLIYVAGQAPQTPVKASTDGGRFALLCTAEGDGRVPWASGIPEVCKAGGRVYYVNAVHGDLPKARDAYEGYVDLLERGRSDKLASKPPVTRGAADLQVYDDTDAGAALHPTRDDLLAAATGGTLQAAARAADDTLRTQVRVFHGDLLYAQSPLLIGHVAGANTLEYAEKLVDQALGGRLQNRLDAGLHAGALGTYTLYRRQGSDNRSNGAIVVGMGRIGELSSGQLTLAVSRAVAAYALDEIERYREREGSLPGEALALGISTLLIGAGIGELSLQDSVAAILRGHRDARGRLHNARIEHLVRLDRLDFIEIMEDRAILAQRSAQDAVELDSSLGRHFDVAEALLPLGGGRRRAYAAAEEGLWQRIAISVVGDTTGADPRLIFNAYGNLARSEQMVNTVPLKDIERFTQSLISTEQDQEQVGRSLFELLVPNWLKDQAPDRRRAQLIVDENAAAFPWELLRDRSSEYDSDGDKPLSVRSGLVRQLATGTFRPNVQRPTKNNALIVGDPLLGEWASLYRPLDGAAREAEAVCQRLAGAQFTPTLEVRKNGPQVLVDLFRDEWRILHLSGHGVYREDLPAAGNSQARAGATGMLIGEGDLLTTAHIAQMRIVPDFVFVNCCSLGRIEGDSGADSRPGDPRLAANLATELIQIGVRGVIAAGWQVIDEAALLFADTFYASFLAGEAFGEAVLAARRATFDQFGQSNTWGAYQCYGDPGFVLPRANRPDADSDEKPVEYRFVAAAEVLNELERLTLHAKVTRSLGGAGPASPARHAEPLFALCERRGWSAQGAVLEGFGKLWGEYSQHDKAIDFYRRALAAPDGAATRKAEEQLANMLTRHAQVLADGQQFDAALGALDEAERVLALTPGRQFATDERINLQGAINKRRLACLVRAQPTLDDLRKALKAVHDTYAEAERAAVAAGGRRYYAGNNADQIAALRLLAGDLGADDKQATADSLQAIDTELGAGFTPTNFWERVSRSDLALAHWLFDVASGQADGSTLNGLCDGYKSILDLHATPRERESVLTTISTLNAAASCMTDFAATKSKSHKSRTTLVRDGLRTLLDTIRA